MISAANERVVAQDGSRSCSLLQSVAFSGVCKADWLLGTAVVLTRAGLVLRSSIAAAIILLNLLMRRLTLFDLMLLAHVYGKIFTW